ncbi:MAG: hypothetical protein NTW27_03315 [Deltaproteobacteria bacterium]|nr:hypothetical protein [Deltaproteobacteria bacterium]
MMQRGTRSWFTVLIAGLVLSFSAVPSFAEELIIKSCSELIRLATNYQEDVKTIDTVLGTAIEAGTLESIKIYKLKKSVAQKNLDAVLKAIDLKECAKNK